MKWEKKHTLEETVEWRGLAESDMQSFKAYVNEKTPGICGTYAAASLTVLMAKREGVVTQSMDELLKGMEASIEYALPYRGTFYWDVQRGLNKQETREKYGDEQVLLWRRSYDVMPPLLSEEEAAKQAKDPRYKHLQVKDLPQGETLKTTLDRVLPIWQDEIAVDLLDGKNVLVVAHGNSLRSLVKYLLNLSEEEILKFEIPTATPLVFDLDENLQVKEYHFEK